MYPVQAYHCSYCKVFKLRKYAVVNHEKKCFHNPETMSCATCLFYDRETYIENGSGVFYVLICHKGISFYPGIEIKNVFDTFKPQLKTSCSMWIERPEDGIDTVNLLSSFGYAPGSTKAIETTKTDSEDEIYIDWDSFFNKSPF